MIPMAIWWRRVAMRGTATLAVASLISACGSGATPATGPAAAVSITVQAHGPGTRLSAGFVGLGLMDNTLARNEFSDTNLGGYLRRLGPHGLLRISGNSVESFWTSTGESAPTWSGGEITPTDLHALARVIRGTGWRVILGVPVKHTAPARAADEARYARRILGPALAALEIGNEPNHYGITEASYFARFERFVRAIERAVPGLAIAGPATGREAPTWVAGFTRDEARHPDVALFTSHEYPLSVCGAQHPTIAELLGPTSERHEVAAADSTAAAARALGVPAVMDETNSAVCWGAPGVSNVFASALWILDYGLVLAEHGVAAANFQTRISGCTPYLPLCTVAHGSALYARPEFYGLLALGGLGTGRFLSVTGPGAPHLRTYALATGPGRLSVVLDNLGAAHTVRLQLPAGHYHEARATVLSTGSARGLSATTQITWGGRRVGADGQLAAPRSIRVAVGGDTVTVAVGAHSAAVVKVR